MVKKLFLFVIMLFFIQGVIAETKNYEIENLEDEKSVSFSKESYLLLSNFKVENKYKNRIYFESSVPLKGTSASAKGFVVSGNRVLSVKINNGKTTGHYLKVLYFFDFWDNNTIRYEGGSNIKGTRGEVLPEFTLQYIVNNIKEPESKEYRYVSAKATGKGNGRSESKPWTLAQAFKNASAGMTVWVKAGDYGDGNYKNSRSGMSFAPIKFIGYTDKIGDKPVLNRSQTTKFNKNKMPLIKSSSNRGVAVHLASSRYVIIRNFQIDGYETSFMISKSKYTILDNCYVKNNKYGFKGHPHYKSTQNRIINSYASNALMDGVFLSGARHLVDNVYVSSKGRVGMDYYIVIVGGEVGEGNHIIRNSTVVRDPNDKHMGHGISLKAQGRDLYYNLIENCSIDNVAQAIELRHSQVKYNVARNITATGSEHGNLVTFRDGTSNNIIENSYAENISTAIKFSMNKGEDKGTQAGGFDNKVINTVINGSNTIIGERGIDGARMLRSKGNEFLNCVFYKADLMFKGTELGSSNVFNNCVVLNVKKRNRGKLNTKFINSDFFNSWGKEKGSGNIYKDPKFIDVKRGDFHLKKNSPLIDKGTNLDDVKYDYNNKARYKGKSTDIGAYEYASVDVSVKADAGIDVTICNGEEAVLTANGGDTYLWSTGETTQSIVVSPDETKTYSVTAYKGSNSDADDVKVIVNKAPSVKIASTKETICLGEEITLTAEGEGEFKWSTGEVGESIVVNPSSTTKYTVTASNSCATSVTKEITITVLETIELEVEKEVVNICSGESATLTATSNASVLWSTGATSKSIEVSPNKTTVYTVSSSNASCVSQKEVRVEVNTAPSVEITSSKDTICSEEEVILTAEGVGEFTWSTGETGKSIEVSPDSTTKYTVTASNSCTTSETKEITITVLEAIELEVEQEVINICSGESATLTATSNATISWSTGATTNSIQVSPNKTTIYTVSSSNSICSIDREIRVEVNEAPKVNVVSSKKTVCLGEEVTLTAEGEGEFIWSTGETGNSIEVSPNSTTKYTVTASNSCATSVTKEITITVLEAIELEVEQEVINICSGESATLTATSNATISWSTGATTNSVEVSPSKTTIYTVSSSNSSCTSQKTITVKVNEAPSVSIVSSKKSICLGESVTLTAFGGGNFTWSTGETGKSIEVRPSSDTTYTATASNSCSTSVTAEVTIAVLEAVDLSVSEDVSICSGESVTLTATSNEAVLWSTGATTKSIEVSPKSTTVYTVYSGNSNCSSEKTVTVTVNSLPSVSLRSSKSSVCSGEAVTLTAEGIGEFTWSTGETGKSIEVSPTSTTTYSVTASNSCSASARVQVTIAVLEAVDLSVSEDVSICSGERVTLTATSNEDVLWSTGATTNSIEVSPTSTTTYTVSSGNSNCSSEKTVTVTVNTAPSVELSSSKSSICLGESVTLTVEGEGDFTWSTGETGKSIEVSPTSTTTYSVTASNSCSTSVTAEVTVVVNSLPSLTISGNVTINKGETVTLMANGQGDFLWSTGETTSNINVSPDATTTYNVSLTNESGCSVSKEMIVTVVNSVAPIIEAYAGEDVTVCKGKKVTLKATGGDSYLWSTGENTPNIEVEVNETKLYSVKVYKGNDYKTAYVTVYVDESCEDDISSTETSFNVYPNPVNNMLNINLVGYRNSVKISIVGINGSVLDVKKINNLTKDRASYQMSFSRFAKGVYFVKLLNNGKTEVKKVMRI